MGSVKERAVKLQGKLDYMQNNLSLKAVKIYSAAKYPASHTYKDYELAIKQPHIERQKPLNVYKSSVPIAETTKATLSSKTENGQYACNVNLQEKLQFYHVRSKLMDNKRNFGKDDDNEIPSRLSSVSALLLFNSTKSPYERPTQDKDKDNKIEDAPDSILQPWHASDIEASSNYLYAPTLGEVM